MDKIRKFLKRLSKKELKHVLRIMDHIEQGQLDGMDVKKLSGTKNAYRVRVGQTRIIFLKSKTDYRLYAIEKRDDRTYKK
ncbi:MAG: hypothetical protein COU35_05235 [Candidatus Magasanikbacteria bacterium CG10_big_fil_rev_8_21_14_0_10_47_10]|uniref:Type II toxin-antitoxin system RelE/ParE family toxin n=1 Tax=Candidatus Magasanikbacteria bacterium CG10_big_fil_rev_8_21_14_0_10_47_10 TaxID=1974652 RepID=A0A2H0TP17_9BACT|nr:MAG: hypothetical protein COU35_05235 [Candidatus Magasanikbacteria bacterium CG10_big_fil_rev_8_21_14_0_10_47_10]